jgi:hypothetical protein
VCGHHQPHLGWANGQSWKKEEEEEEEEEEAGGSTFVLDTITSICTYNVGAKTRCNNKYVHI